MFIVSLHTDRPEGALHFAFRQVPTNKLLLSAIKVERSWMAEEFALLSEHIDKLILPSPHKISVSPCGIHYVLPDTNLTLTISKARVWEN